MILYITAKTSIPDIYIDCIEVELPNGNMVTLSWDESDISREPDGFTARCKGVYIDEEYANGKIEWLEDLRISDIGVHYESDRESDLFIESMEFADGDKRLRFSNPEYLVNGASFSC